MPYGIVSLFHVMFVCVCFSTSAALSADVERKHPFTIDDYFKIKHIVELSLSSDGAMIAYIVTSQSLENNKPIRTVYVSTAVPDAKPIFIEKIQEARNIAWMPGTHELAFLSSDGNVVQLHSINIKNNLVRQLTRSDDPITQFSIAPDGRSIAYITQESLATSSLYRELQTADRGLLVKPDMISVRPFIDPAWRGDSESAEAQHLWLRSNEGETIRVKVPGNAIDFHWAFDSTKLSVTYASGRTRMSLLSDYRTSFGIFDVESERFHVIAAASLARPGEPDRAYAELGWLPGENKLIVRRAKLKDLFVDPRHPEWSIINVSSDMSLVDGNQVWREVSKSGFDRGRMLVPFPGVALINKTLRGGMQSIYQLSSSGATERSAIADDVVGNVAMAAFSADFDLAVFVNDSFTQPPEIYSWRKGEGSRRLTNLNQVTAERLMPVVREVNWQSKDGTSVQGWLLLPEEPAPDQAPWPLITFVHGGPSVPMPAGFAAHFRLWPYPFEVYALNGMAVFLPNYRGNTTFGRAFADPQQVDGEPVEDIISGVEHILEQGFVDPGRLAISGHSHGAWLAPLVMSRAKNFRAASFAEGWGNTVTVYDLMAGRLNRELHDVNFGASLYNDPERYLTLSPALHFQGLRTATLFEAGNRSLAIAMLSYPKAAKYAGMPTEFIIYPKTGHNLSIPRMQKESATRNLDWFRFWLKGEEDSSPIKVKQYKRWRAMRQQQEAHQQSTDKKSERRSIHAAQN